MNSINIKMFKPKGNIKQVLITIHGFAGDSDSSVILNLAKELIKNDILVIAFDLPCHGLDKNDGILKLTDCLNYLEEVENYVEQNYADIPISYFATSFGAYLLLNHIKNNEKIYENIILRAPAIFMSDVIKEKLLTEHGYTFLDLQKNILNLGYARNLKIDINFYEELVKNSLADFKNDNYFYIIQGKKDDIVDYTKNQKFFKKLNIKHKIYYFKDADHRFKHSGELEKIIKISKNILIK